MIYKMNLSDTQYGFLLMHEVHFWIMKEEYDDVEIEFPNEDEFIHAQTLISIME